MPIFTASAKQDFNIAARAVQSNDELFGVARINVRLKPATRGHINGFCLPFKVLSQDEIAFMRDTAFLYGSVSNLRFNYFRGVPEEAFAHGWIDREKNSSKAQASKWVIPLEYSCLEGHRLELIDAIIENPYEFVGASIEELAEIKVADLPEGSLGQYFSDFPLALRRDAEKKGSFYASGLRKSERVQGSSYFIKPGKRKVLTFSTPMGGMPDWAQDLWRKTRRK